MSHDYENQFAAMFTKTALTEFENLSIEEMERALLAKPLEKVAKREILPIESVDLADEWGRELAHDVFEKIALGVMNNAMGSVMGPMRRGVGTAMNYATHAPMMNRMGVGAAIGGVMGAMRNPGMNPNTGQMNSRTGNMMQGAMTGGALGYAAKPMANAVSGMQNGMGSFARGAMARGGMRPPAASPGAITGAMVPTTMAQAPSAAGAKGPKNVAKKPSTQKSYTSPSKEPASGKTVEV